MQGYWRWLKFWGLAIAAAMLLPMWVHPVAATRSPQARVVQLAQNHLDALVQQGHQQFDDRDYAGAAQSYREVLEQLPQSHSTADYRPLVTNNLARTYLLTGQYEPVVPLLETLDANGQASPNALSNLALAYYSLGNYAQAEQILTRVLTEWEAIRAGDDLDALDKVTLFEQQAYSYTLMQRSLVAQGKTTAALEVAERAKARALVEQLVQQQRGDRQPDPLTAAQMQAVARQQNTTLVVYAALGDGRRVLGNEVETETDLYAWVIAPQGEIQFRQTPLSTVWQGMGLRSAVSSPLSPFETLVQQTREALGVTTRGIGVVPTARRVTDDLPPTNPLPLRSLYEILIQPIAPLLPTDSSDLVTFIPQGPLFLVPFAALPAGDDSYLVDQHAIALSPAVHTLSLVSGTYTASCSSLIVGNPVTMPSLAPAPGLPPQSLPPLPGAEAEAIVIADLFGTEPLIREQATETAIVQQMPQQSIIHLATHGLLNLDARLNEFGLPTDPSAPTATDSDVYVTPGAIIVGDNVTVGGTDASVALARERVVRVSMPGVLAFAASATDDGWLTAEEISALDLQADLVILSACDTGRGRITGDGVVGLARAFLAAGADTVIVSLWQVPDEPTAALMVAFYEQLAQTANKAIALQNAMQLIQNQFPDPRNWSAFVLVGESR